MRHEERRNHLSLFQRMANSYQKTQATFLLAQGRSLNDGGQYQAAERLFEQALAISRRLADPTGEAKALNSLGGIYSVQGRYQEALALLSQSLRIAREIGNQGEESRALGNMGICYLALGDIDKALAYLNQRLVLAQERHDDFAQIDIYTNLSNVSRSRGDYHQALEYQEHALQLARQHKNLQSEGLALGNIGSLYFQLSDYNQAIKYLEQSLVIAYRVKDVHGQGYTLGELGNVYTILGEYDKALAFIQQRLAIARTIGDGPGASFALGGLGYVFRLQGNYLKAIECQQQRLQLAQGMGEKKGIGAALGNLGNIYLELGEYQQAKTYQLQQLQIAQETQDAPTQGHCYGNLGGTCLHLKQYEEAHTYYQQGLALAQKLSDRRMEEAILNGLGNFAMAQGDYALADEYWQTCLELAQKIDDLTTQALVLGNLGGVQSALGKYEEAISYQRRSLKLASEVGNRSIQGTALHNLGYDLLQLDRFAEAEAALTEAVNIWITIRADLKSEDAYKVSIFDQQAGTYQWLQVALVAQQKIEAALEVAEQGRAQALLELLERSITPLPRSTDPVNLSRLPFAQIQRIVREQQATVVEYSLIGSKINKSGEEHYPGGELFIWVIHPDGHLDFQRTNAQSLVQALLTQPTNPVQQLREALGLRGQDRHPLMADNSSLHENLRYFHRLLIEPIASLLPTDQNARVIFIPQHILFLLPFCALQDPAGRYLIETHTLLIAPSIQLLDRTHQQRQKLLGANGEVLIVGNPAMPLVRLAVDQPLELLPSLPNAQAEAEAIAELFHVQALTNTAATKVAVLERMPSARLIHLATHGFLDEFAGMGLPGAVALAPTDEIPESGLLTSEEILQLKLIARLVVLSACNTGQGRITGDSIIGLSRSFIVAGVPSLIVSLWSVPDIPTAFLMTTFYQALQHKQNLAQALRHAMLTTKQYFDNPIDWAPFTLIGESLIDLSPFSNDP